jgi:hypothetical protein
MSNGAIDMSCHQRGGNAEVLAAIAAITGRSLIDTDAAFHEARRGQPDERHATAEVAQAFIDRLKTRLGLAPAVDAPEAAELKHAFEVLVRDESLTITLSDLAAWDEMLRYTPEHINTLDRDPVILPPLPKHQTEMWQTLLEFEDLGPSWVLVGGQMTMLHCLENGLTLTRPTDDGDVVVGVWTRRDALHETSRFLRDRGYDEVPTSDGYGYRFKRGESTVIDVLLPEGLGRQRAHPTTTSGRRGFSTEGGNQALARAERVPVVVEDRSGFVRRPNLLGSIVAKAHAFVADSRDVGRHAEDIVTLTEIALRDPGTTLRGARSGDRKPVRCFLRGKAADHAYFRAASDPATAFAFLTRLGDPQH